MQYIIIYHNGGKKWVNYKQAEYISKAMDNPVNKFIDIGDETKIAISSISVILSEREYKEQYPDKQKQGQIFRNNFPQLADKIDYQDKSIDEQAICSTNGRQQLVASLQRYIDENPNRCENAKQLLKEKKIKFGLI